MHVTPAGFPKGIPGMNELIEGAIQHAPQPGLQSIEGTSKNSLTGASRRWQVAQNVGPRSGRLRVNCAF